MEKKTAQRIEELDRQITVLRATLSDLSATVTRTEKGMTNFPLLRKKKMLEKEIQRLRTVLHLLLESQARPWFLHRLPREVLVKIFDWVTDPAEQLKLLRTFPSLGPLMKWEESTLIFKQVYPLIVDQLTDPRELWKLCMVSRGYMNVVLEHLKANLSMDTGRHATERPSEQGLADLVSFFEELGRTEWMAEMPFMKWPCFSLMAMKDHEKDEEGALFTVPEYVQRFLNAHGSKVWSCEIALDSDKFSENRAKKLINQILKGLPNLVRLSINNMLFLPPFPCVNVTDYPEPWAELPNLRSLSASHSRPVTLSLVQRYSPQLKALCTRGDMKTGGLEGCHFNKLESYDINSWVGRWNGPDDLWTQFTGGIQEAPLKHISVSWSEANQARGHAPTPELLTALSHFGSTLESLKLWDTSRFVNDQERILDIPNELITEITLPKLRRLSMVCRVRNLDWLLALPSLETLELIRRNENGVVWYDPPSSLLQFPRSIDTPHSTNIWLHLPSLKKLKMIRHIYPYGGSDFRDVVSREDYEDYHQRRLVQNSKEKAVVGNDPV